MGLLAGVLGDWARGGRWGEVALPTISKSGLVGRVWLFWATMVSSAGGSGVLVRGARRDGNWVQMAGGGLGLGGMEIRVARGMS